MKKERLLGALKALATSLAEVLLLFLLVCGIGAAFLSVLFSAVLLFLWSWEAFVVIAIMVLVAAKATIDVCEWTDHEEDEEGGNSGGSQGPG